MVRRHVYLRHQRPLRSRVDAAVGEPGWGEGGGLRIALSPYLFRGMLVGMGTVAVALHRLTGDRELTWRFAKARARTLAWMLGVRVQVRGLEHLAAGGPFVFTPNHQSHLDILVLLGYLPGRTRFAAKRELWRHPVVAAVLDTLGMIPIERDQPERAVDALSRAGRDESIVIFPEGRRSLQYAMGTARPGVGRLAIQSRATIVPCVIYGTWKAWPHLTALPHPAKIVVNFLPPLQVEGEDTRENHEKIAQRRVVRIHPSSSLRVTSAPHANANGTAALT